jgi:hypothetical protein
MNRIEKNVLKNIKANASKVTEDTRSLIEGYTEAMQFIIEKGLYADFTQFQAEEAHRKI